MNKIATVSLIIIVVITLFAIFAPFFTRFGNDQIVQGSENLPPSVQHFFGTDSLGRDMFARCMIGARISLSIGIISTFMVVVIGVLIGSVSGYFGGKIDMILMRMVDIFYSIPTMLIVIILQVFFNSSIQNVNYNQNFWSNNTNLILIYFVLALLYWMDVARLVRGQVLSLKHNEYVLAAKVMGASSGHIIRKHLIPSMMGTIIVSATYIIPQAIALEALLSFLGLGVSPPLSSLGSLCANGIADMVIYPFMLIIPAVLMSIIIVCFNLLGDGIRDALDPRLKDKF